MYTKKEESMTHNEKKKTEKKKTNQLKPTQKLHR